MTTLPRKVKLSTILNILMKRPIPMLIGLIFTFVPIMLVVIFALVFSTSDTPKVDFDLVDSHGKDLTAKITDIETQYNTTINGVHPTIISYKYSLNDKEIESRYKVLEERKLDTLINGAQITIKEFEGKTIIKGLRPYKFPVEIIILLPILFLIFGLPFLFYSFIKLRKELKLFKNGILSKGKIISMTLQSGIPVSGIRKGIIVFYEYEVNGVKITTESLTNDLSLIGEKKNGDYIPIFVSDEKDEDSCIVPKLDSLRNKWGIEFR